MFPVFFSSYWILHIHASPKKMRISKRSRTPSCSIWAHAVILLAVVSPDQLSLSLSLCLKCSLSNKNLVALLCLYAVFWLSSGNCLVLLQEMEGEKAGRKIYPDIYIYFFVRSERFIVFRILWKCNKNILENIDNLSKSNHKKMGRTNLLGV